MSKQIQIVHLYSAEMNIYGDRGNIITLAKRLEWRGFEAIIKEVSVGDQFDFTSADIVFSGGGQDRGQILVGADLLKRAENILDAVEKGVVMLTICGTYQLFGRGFTTMEGQEIPGINVFKASTVGSNHRMIGNITVETPWGTLTGFENHSGETFLESNQPAMGIVTKGYGNNYSSGSEGAVARNAFGTYLHGPILPKNPGFADHLIRMALSRHGIESLPVLDDSLENLAHDSASARSQ